MKKDKIIQSLVIFVFLTIIGAGGYFAWRAYSTPISLERELSKIKGVGAAVVKDFLAMPEVAIAETTDTFNISDAKTNGPTIVTAAEREQGIDKQYQVNFPKDLVKPLEVKLGDGRSIFITDTSGAGFNPQLIKKDGDLPATNSPDTFLQYSSADGRKEVYYAYQKDSTTGQRQLKNWLIYKTGKGAEHEAYQFSNARLKLNPDGSVGVYYYGEQEKQTEAAPLKVEGNLMERARLALAKDGIDMNQNGPSVLTIPKPYYLDKNQQKHELEWKLNSDNNMLELAFTADKSLYPIALDPTLQFTAPGQSVSGAVIDGEAGYDNFGTSLAAGDFNADGKIDLAVGAYNANRVYLFYNDGSYPVNASAADAIITGETTSYFGLALAAGDFNADGKADLAVGASAYNSWIGRVYLFYNDSSYPATASTADAIITGEVGSRFGFSFAAGDFNADGKTDLAVGAIQHSSYAGRVYLFYNDGSYPATASTADAIITGEAGSYFGYSLAAGDLNADGKTDLAVGATGYGSSAGRVYLFYNDGSYTATASTADAIITGGASSQFGASLAVGDFNADGKIDLAVGAIQHNSYAGRVYLFYNDGSYPVTASTADAIITGEAGSFFGNTLAAGDFNADGKIDLAVGATYNFSSQTGRAYLFYNDGSYTATASTADAIITGETGSMFGTSLAAGDFNADGKTDLAVGARGYNSEAGRAYIFYNNNGIVDHTQNIAGENWGSSNPNTFGNSLAAGDFNADGKIDLAVGAYNVNRVYLFYNDGSYPAAAAAADTIITGDTSISFGRSLVAGDFNDDGKIDLAVAGNYDYVSSAGRVYLFYNDGSYPSSAASADVIITGEVNNIFGDSLAAGDFNADGKTDLAIGALIYNSSVGRVYLFYNDGSYTATASTADAIITGEDGSNFSTSLAAGDFNADGKTDLAVGAYGYNSNTGRAYLFYNDGSYTATASTADAIITGENGSYFGTSLAAGDFNYDGKTDLAVGAEVFNTPSAGRAYFFYNDGSYTDTASTADAIITGEDGSHFGIQIAAGDFNADNKTDLAITASYPATGAGHVYLFYNDGSYTATASTADAIIIAESESVFGISLAAGDFNADGKTDLAVGAFQYNFRVGRAYLFFNNGSYPDTASTADAIITGSVTRNFGISLAAGDFNDDGKTDLAVGAFDSLYTSNPDNVYLFYNDGSYPASAASADVIITAEVAYTSFGDSLAVGDFNYDGKTDLAVGASAYNLRSGRVYLFYNDGAYPASAASADVIITGTSMFNYFGYSLAAGDFNDDGKTDLAVGKYMTTNNKIYIFYNDGSYPSDDASADVIITGEAPYDQFGSYLVSGDFNNDGKTDLGTASVINVYLFFNDGSYPSGAASADVIITHDSSSGFFNALAAGDFNADGKTDLVVGAYYSARAYLFFNDGSYPSSAASADVIITGQTNSYFSSSLAAGDFNADGKTDLAVGAYTDSGFGRVYFLSTGLDGNPPESRIRALFKRAVKFIGPVHVR